jgi:hypothetical protein
MRVRLLHNCAFTPNDESERLRRTHAPETLNAHAPQFAPLIRWAALVYLRGLDESTYSILPVF